MEVKLLLQHGSNIYDVTPILEGGVELRRVFLRRYLRKA